MRALPEPKAQRPLLYGTPVSSGSLLDWSWARDRLATARNYWVASVSPGGQPHCRPVRGVWLGDGFWFSTGSLARRNLISNPRVTVHLGDSDQVVILQGEAARLSITGTAPPEDSPVAESPGEAVHRFLNAYNDKYDWDMVAAGDGVGDAEGAAGPLFQVRPHVVFGWGANMRTPTRWSFT